MRLSFRLLLLDPVLDRVCGVEFVPKWPVEVNICCALGRLEYDLDLPNVNGSEEVVPRPVPLAHESI